jgi:hypothetical protein
MLKQNHLNISNKKPRTSLLTPKDKENLKQNELKTLQE